jgi:UDP-2,3-diacylglucosamine pyrophosphatase LpxH
MVSSALYQGYRYDWKIEEAQKNLLRTHTTAVSARMLYKLAQQKEFKPQKYFSIDKVRFASHNESMYSRSNILNIVIYHHHHHQPIYVSTAGAQVFLMNHT